MLVGDKKERVCRQGGAAGSWQPVGRRWGGARLGFGLGRRNEVPRPPERPLRRQRPGRRGRDSGGGFGVQSQNGGLLAVGILRVETQRQSF